LTLRLTNSIKAKRDKREQYLRAGVITDEDPFVIALNAGGVDFSRIDVDPPRVIGCLFGIGDFSITINPETHELVHAGHQVRTEVHKAGGAPVGHALFADSGYNGISAVIYSCNTPFNLTDDRELQLVALNPIAKNPVDQAALPVRKMYWVDGRLLRSQ